MTSYCESCKQEIHGENYDFMLNSYGKERKASLCAQCYSEIFINNKDEEE